MLVRVCVFVWFVSLFSFQRCIIIEDPTNQGEEKEEGKKREVAGRQCSMQEEWAGPSQGMGGAMARPVFTGAEQDVPDVSLAEGKR